MGMYQNIQDILKVLRNDEEILRLLYYMPKNIAKKIPDPLDKSLPDILTFDPLELKKIREDLIMLTPKDDDLVNASKCRLFVYLGDRFPNGGRKSFQTVTQDVVVDIFCQADFENGDMRSNRIADRLNDIFCLKPVTGLGKMDYSRGRIISRVPSQYVAYQHVYEFGGTKS
ncbi:hypothetical protein [Cytobacillus praedii]|uniref:Uncharacterized protein n=1 Tax=Cytobacillus praedii TaxID=1742358 RepID=A0A4R1ATY3_9BACI|nr:hypothetical protein [Cytobacillus praedii]TCJ01083.1 hypothetical protein E0Y62_25795 [Cytobacillus praedii]